VPCAGGSKVRIPL